LRDRINENPQIYSPLFKGIADKLPETLDDNFDLLRTALDLDDSQNEPVRRTLAGAVKDIQSIAGRFENGDIALNKMRSRFWEIYDGLDDTMSGILNDGQMNSFLDAKASALARTGHQWLPELVGGGAQGRVIKGPVLPGTQVE